MKLLTALLGKPEEINGGERCPTCLYRWFLMRTRWFKVYLHHFVADDWSLDLHDHPKRFISIGLKGWYAEYTPQFKGDWISMFPNAPWTKRIFRAPWIRTFPAEHIHRIAVPSKSCWTLVIVLRGSREWGFWHLGKFIHWRKYVDGFGGIADEMKACGDDK